ncbi:uncharacterized protein LOC129571970 [Sitodiplosis mosellana]|uniref:uncharacterized protein LOC129571969 n=1 Tax=Sitodiplosis mosellana TaxID=263140 RepID=UPI00244427CC|nr:uncharacterized protein LOC129571969 [Sitodiplosis mosellana]XP_055307837.1 uncharacterized protein LOC129571970 [Sitodiplosis mosellana]
MSKLEKLLSVRKRALGDLDHHVAEIKKFNEQSNTTAVAFRTVALEKAFREFAESNDELEKMSAYHEIQQLDDLNSENRKVQDKYLEIKLHIATILPNDENTLNSTFYPSPRERSAENAEYSGEKATGIKMPAIQLTPFDGDYEKWPEFRDMFTSLMNKYRGDDVEKLTHLKNYLKGPAFEAVKYLGLENGNYDAAWDELKISFENKSAIIDANLRKFTEIPFITSASVQSVRHALSTTRSCLSMIKRFDILTDTWDPIMVFLLKEKLSPELRTKWEEERKGSFEPASLKTFYNFLEIRAKVLLAMPPRKPYQKSTPVIKPPVKTFTLTKGESIETPGNDDLSHEEDLASAISADDTDAMFMINNRKTEKCNVCNENHRTFHCPKLTTNSKEALKLVNELKLCINCLYKHESSACTSKFVCRTCAKNHNSLLHDALTASTAQQVLTIDVNKNTWSKGHSKRALLATALVPIKSKHGEVVLRALIDQGSTTNVLSERGAQLINCSRKKIMEIPMLGLGGVQTGKSNFKTSIVIGSLYEKSFNLSIDAYITAHITTIRPISAETMASWSHLNSIQLADPDFAENKAIDLLIGTQTFGEIIESGLIKGQQNEPIAQKTKLGWITSGSYKANTTSELIQCLEMAEEDEVIYTNILTDENLSEQLKAFWEIEEINAKKLWSEADQECETRFIETISRHDDGKLIMRLPFNHDTSSVDFLGESFERAKSRFFQLEKRFARNEALKIEYTKCIEEYIALGHAIEVPMENYCHAIPHHAVFKESSTTTKLRVVFDASAKTSNGYSLNDRLHIGPTILEDIWAVLLRWRLKRIALTADIEKMYRQFWVHPEDTKFQQILWRSNSNEPIRLYELQTVTFGEAPAPFLAIRGLHYIADEISTKQPEVAQVIKKNFYVDDGLPSVDTIEQANDLQTNLTEVFSQYGLPLRKWHSNISASQSERLIEVKTHPQNSCTALGLQWNTCTDEISFKITLKKDVKSITKRTVLSEIASLFDPLGLLAPLIMPAKMFMRQLWLEQVGWDDSLSDTRKQEWALIRASLLRCSTIRVMRWSGYHTNHKHVSLHGFCDASEQAYDAVLYLRTVLENGTIEVHLITAKTKIAPLKKLSIPRLELCAASLLTKLMEKFIKTIEIPDLKPYAWTDSAIVLAWLSTPPCKLKPFVSHRVSDIQDKIKPDCWRYVKSTMNPADYATREKFANEIVSLTHWWNGPSFLAEEQDKWPVTPSHMISMKNMPELRPKILHQQETKQQEPLVESPILTRYSFLGHLLRVTAYIARWLKRNRMHRSKQGITAEELFAAKQIWIRYVQQLHFSQEINHIRAGKSLNARDSLLSLNPFIDEHGILRVKGRLRNALLPHNTKYPAILPVSSHFTRLIIRQAHFKVLHGGLQLTLRTVREEVWIVRGKEEVKRQLNKCMTCFRDRCRPAQQQMADLLPPQVQPNRPFSHTGVDFAGFFEIKLSTKRNAGTTKCYISLFVCLTTKAIHLEIAHDLSTQAFISALNRFVSRRGIPNDMFSDRGTNFIGTANELPQLWYQEASKESQLIQKACADHGISWHFNPARASHFGGIWEAGVKSVKTHLHRILKDTKLIYEDFNTVLIQIEACLNSRPLCPLSEHPDDLEALTPGHFLIGQALTTLPHPSVEHIPMSRLSRYQALQRMTQTFWVCWSHEYLVKLQQRPKWKKPHANLGVGQLVIIKEDNIPPTKWVLGRILKTYPGKDQLVRCAEVKCRNTIVSRPIHKLCPLPIDDNLAKYERLINDQSLIPGENVDVKSTN